MKIAILTGINVFWETIKRLIAGKVSRKPQCHSDQPIIGTIALLSHPLLNGQIFCSKTEKKKRQHKSAAVIINVGD
jgi:hypothetical protein